MSGLVFPTLLLAQTHRYQKGSNPEFWFPTSSEVSQAALLTWDREVGGASAAFICGEKKHIDLTRAVSWVCGCLKLMISRASVFFTLAMSASRAAWSSEWPLNSSEEEQNKTGDGECRDDTWEDWNRYIFCCVLVCDSIKTQLSSLCSTLFLKGSSDKLAVSSEGFVFAPLVYPVEQFSQNRKV